jgi:diaminohydroxyphosphoribosylaminopyrimidine deaminase/5-amino-6-(5-phosphoribosylamino)uracil reductase
VSFEPCDHYGNTGPCTNAIVKAGISKVIFGAKDRTKKTSGAKALRSAGVKVAMPSDNDPLSLAAESVVYRWQFAQMHGRPWVTLKLATSIDGHLKHPTSPGAWFTSEQSRQDVHDLRELADAVVVGTGTVLTDNPALTARNIDQSQRLAQPKRVVIGDREIPGNARVLLTQPGQTSPVIRLARQLPKAILSELFAKGINHVLLESGPKLSGAFIDTGLVDELVWFVAPVWFGSGDQTGQLNPAALSSIEPISVAKRGSDLRIHGHLLSTPKAMAA